MGSPDFPHVVVTGHTNAAAIQAVQIASSLVLLAMTGDFGGRLKA
jgi:hypothetical protein